ncbi:hypothetical protein OAA34_00725 [bacterium]|nr:hypothetical protein [bacterium]
MIQILKLSSGEELIGTVTDFEVEGRQVIKMDKPAVIIMQPIEGQPEKFGIGLAPYAPYAENNSLNIMPTHVIAIMQPTDNLKNEYNTHYGSGVIVPEKAKIVT